MKAIFSIFLLFILGIILYSCNRNNFVEERIPENKLTITNNHTDSFSARYRSGSLTLVYNAQENNSVTASSLEFINSEIGGPPVAKINFSVDANQPAYKLMQHENVVKQAKILSSQLKASDVKVMADLFEVFGSSIIADKSTNNFSQVVQSLAFHKAILSTIKRAGTTEDCGCTPYPGYFVDKSFFLCQEDVLVDPNLYVKILKQGNYKMNAKEKTFFNFLESKQNMKSVSIDEVYSFIEPKKEFLERIDNSLDRIRYTRKAQLSGISIPKNLLQDCLKGSDWGCCGNYSGCCYFAAIECYLHDAACSYSKCQPRWICFSGCKPD